MQLIIKGIEFLTLFLLLRSQGFTGHPGHNSAEINSLNSLLHLLEVLRRLHLIILHGKFLLLVLEYLYCITL